MKNWQKAKEIAERLRHEPSNLLTNDCFIKSIKMKRWCGKLGIPAQVVACIGVVRAKVFRLWWLTIPVIHGWVEIDGRRMEVSRPLGAAGTWGVIPGNIRPVIRLRF
jgi:hypothetical protein